MRETLEEQHTDLKEQRQLMEEQSHQLQLLRQHMMLLTAGNPHPPPDTHSATAAQQQDHATITAGDNTAEVDTTNARTNNLSKDGANMNNTTKVNTNTIKEHVPLPAANTGSSKSNWVRTHRSTFNSYHSNASNASHSSNVTAHNLNPSTNSTFCLNVPPNSHVASYRGAKRSAPAPLYRGYRKK